MALLTNGKGHDLSPNYLNRFSRYYASIESRPVMRLLIACAIVVVCWYAFLICARCGAIVKAFLGVMRVGLGGCYA